MRTSTPRAPRAISTIAPRGVPSGATAMAPTWARTITTSAPRARTARASAFIAGTGGKNWNSRLVPPSWITTLLDPMERGDPRRRHEPGAVRRDGVGGEVREAGVRHQRAQVADAPVEVVIAQRIDVDAHEVRGQHGGDVVEERRQRRRGAERVAGRDHQRAAGIRRALGVEVGLERGGATDLARLTALDDADRLDLAVPVADVDDRDSRNVGRPGLEAHAGG